MEKVNKDRLLGILCLVAAAIVAAATNMIAAPNVGDEPGPRLFPFIACIMMAVGGAALIIKPKANKPNPYLTREGWFRLFTIFGIYILYLALLYLAGFRIAAAVVLFITSSLFAQGQNVSLIKRAAYSVVLTAAIYIMYVTVFQMNVPKGIF